MKLLISFLILALPNLSSAEIIATPSAISFFNVYVGGIGQSQTVYVRNTGDEPARIQVNNYCYGDFNIANWCYSLVQPGSYCTLNITFRPYRPGYQTCSIMLQDDQSGYEQVSVSGNGVER